MKVTGDYNWRRQVEKIRWKMKIENDPAARIPEERRSREEEAAAPKRARRNKDDSRQQIYSTFIAAKEARQKTRRFNHGPSLSERYRKRWKMKIENDPAARIPEGRRSREEEAAAPKRARRNKDDSRQQI